MARPALPGTTGLQYWYANLQAGPRTGLLGLKFKSEQKMEDFRIAKASPDDVNRIMELVNKAFEVSIGDSGKGFKKKTAQRFKDTKVVYMYFSLRLQLASTEWEKKIFLLQDEQMHKIAEVFDYVNYVNVNYSVKNSTSRRVIFPK